MNRPTYRGEIGTDHHWGWIKADELLTPVYESIDRLLNAHAARIVVDTHTPAAAASIATALSRLLRYRGDLFAAGAKQFMDDLYDVQDSQFLSMGDAADLGAGFMARLTEPELDIEEWMHVKATVKAWVVAAVDDERTIHDLPF